MIIRKQVHGEMIFSTNDVYGNVITLRRKQWDKHIIDVNDGHPEMIGHESLVKKTVEDPHMVRVGKYPNTLVFISETNVGPFPEGIRVAASYSLAVGYKSGADKGQITTAYPIDWVTYGNPNLNDIIYTREGGHR